MSAVTGSGHMTSCSAPAGAQAAVLLPSHLDTTNAIEVGGYALLSNNFLLFLTATFLFSVSFTYNFWNDISMDFDGEVTLDSLMAKMITTGFQATNIGLAIEEINKMVCAIIQYIVIAFVFIRVADSTIHFGLINIYLFLLYRFAGDWVIDP